MTVDKMILALLVLPETLGAYVFFATICSAFWGVFETGVLTFYWPRMLEAAKQGDAVEEVSARRALARVCLIGAPALAAMSLAVGAGFAWLLPDKAYAANLALLPYLAAAYMFIVLANVPHYRLFAGNRDIAIVLSNGASFATFLAVAGLLSLVSPVQAVPIALMVACMLMLALKSAAVWWGGRAAALKG
jgi:O-antigen/teichoic acid export membrane protein